MTRPHNPDKCYTASRWPDEGRRILCALVEIMKSHPDASLVIKPHPYEETDQYDEVIQELPLSMRTRIKVNYNSIESPIEVEANSMSLTSFSFGLSYKL